MVAEILVALEGFSIMGNIERRRIFCGRVRGVGPGRVCLHNYIYDRENWDSHKNKIEDKSEETKSDNSRIKRESNKSGDKKLK